ncbi:MAG: beta-galactosidase family protein [Bacteroidota bacterium]
MNGKPYRIFSGEMHYSRIPQEYWIDRLLKAKAMGLNTICTYIFWNLHEPQPGRFDFSGRLDVAKYIRTAQEIGLNVTIRPGPYVCSEWDLGGLPSWLLKDKDIKLRCSDPKYLKAVERYIMRLGKELKGLQVTSGGPIIMVQIENEYGSYGNDKEYLRTLKSMFQKAGFNVPFYTSDGGADYLLESGTLPGVLPVVNFGGSPAEEFGTLAKFRSGIPHMCGEFWCGWFTHWGDTKWGGSDIEKQKEEIKWMLENNKSFNLYMFHGGTNFGWMAGANYSTKYEPDVTSYDFDAPLDEAGRPTRKFFIVRDLLAKYQPEDVVLPALPDSLPAIEIPEIELTEVASLFENMPSPKNSPQPKSMEELGQDYGFILYRTKLIGPKSGNLTITDLRDYGQVYINGTFIDTVDRTRNENSIRLQETKGEHPVLDILVEAMGRINFGQQLIDRKGITERVTLRGITLMNWEVYNLPMGVSYLKKLKFSQRDTSDSPKFFGGSFELAQTGDTYLDMSKWKKGVVWINGHHLGRYWEIGPQYKLFVPAPWLKRGKNQVIVFDLQQRAPTRLRTTKAVRE